MHLVKDTQKDEQSDTKIKRAKTLTAIRFRRCLHFIYLKFFKAKRWSTLCLVAECSLCAESAWRPSSGAYKRDAYKMPVKICLELDDRHIMSILSEFLALDFKL